MCFSFLATKVIHLDCGTSYHKPFFILPLGILPRHQKPWRFEQVWLEKEGCHAMIRAAWRNGNMETSMALVEDNLKQCQIKLQWWCKVSFGNIVRNLVDKRKQLKKAKLLVANGGCLDQVL